MDKKPLIVKPRTVGRKTMSIKIKDYERIQALAKDNEAWAQDVITALLDFYEANK